MRESTSPVFSPTKRERERSYSLAGGLSVRVAVTRSPYGLEQADLFGMAARKNKKRGFLFVSKALGKHIAVHPALGLTAGALLGDLYATTMLGRKSTIDGDLVRSAFAGDSRSTDTLYKQLITDKIRLNEPTLFIGFAETATALGHSMFDIFAGNVAYAHSTRERVASMRPLLAFEEEHSHATAHRCYADDETLFREASRIVLVDDELTTGKTALNIIKELHETFGQRDFVVASLLDWRSPASRSRFADMERDLGVTIRCLSLMEGDIDVSGEPEEVTSEGTSEVEPSSVSVEGNFDRIDISGLFAHAEAAYLKHTGRFGVTARQGEELDSEVAKAAEALRAVRTGRLIVCIGTGEFMFVPMRIAAQLGEGVVFQSTTRSPIHPLREPEYAVTSAYRFDAVDDSEVANFVYNIEPGQYDEAFVFVERTYDAEPGESFEMALRELGIPSVRIVAFGGGSEIRL
ncbi:phosphoribosyltransferase family protein [Cohnella soli]|uniref:Phosphoribosyltransferase family protein n=1 Tax=Cohnella soli TaxID=425005 RepID=A0ABW0HVT5_9BACL